MSRAGSNTAVAHTRNQRRETAATFPAGIILFNIKYSPNLGDGVIAECLEHELGREFPNATITSVDLAGRASWAPPRNARVRLAQLALLQRLPRPLNDLVVTARLCWLLVTDLRSRWRRALAKADVVVFGGGQLIQDGDLNFPLKLAAVARECRRRGAPFAIFAVGAGPSRSRFGRCLFRYVLQAPKLLHVAARDRQSEDELRRLGSSHVVSCRDPGLLASHLWPAQPRFRRSRLRIGLGVTHGTLLLHHADGDDHSTPAESTALFSILTVSLLDAGFEVTCYSNGAGEDVLALEELRGRLSRMGALAQVSVAPRCETPSQLARLISGFDAVVSHRLHACILAYSYKIPHLGFVWDAKIRHFFDSVRRSRFVIPFNAATVPSVGSLLASALDEGIDEAIHAQTLLDTQDSIRRLASSLAGVMEANGSAVLSGTDFDEKDVGCR
ncbi:MAG: polysaccharide pyruvyl transferase family protein [Bacteroidales bacterium]|nr:polysaccharide pyruvyl transferase family protein [Bacteroidales bacterium]